MGCDPSLGAQERSLACLCPTTYPHDSHHPSAILRHTETVTPRSRHGVGSNQYQVRGTSRAQAEAPKSSTDLMSQAAAPPRPAPVMDTETEAIAPAAWAKWANKQMYAYSASEQPHRLVARSPLGELMGHIVYTVHPQRGIRIAEVRTTKKFQRRGVASALMDQVEQLGMPVDMGEFSQAGAAWHQARQARNSR